MRPNLMVRPGIALLLMAAAAAGQNFTTGTGTAKKFGVHEIALTGDGSSGNPFDTDARVTFTPPSGSGRAVTVNAFYDGGNTWRARVYLSETGGWRWSSASSDDPGLAGKSGSFQAAGSSLRGKLKIHPNNPRQWATDDGRWFLNLNDTAYQLFTAKDAEGNTIPLSDVRAYVRDAAAMGITSLRASGGFKVPDPNSWNGTIFTDGTFNRIQDATYDRVDQRLVWMLNAYPDMYLQFILFPLQKWGQDETVWKSMSSAKKQRIMKYLVARYAAFPQIFWLVVNDSHYGPNFPNNNAKAREVGNYFRNNDPWRHPMATGPNRKAGYIFGGEAWSTYIHLEDEHDLGAARYAPFHPYTKPVFLGEDRYEQDHGTRRDPTYMRYWQRRLFWAWLLTGGSTNYGGRFWVVHPYSQTGSRTAVSPHGPTFTKGLVGLDSVPSISSYFSGRSIELSDFRADAGLARDVDGRTGARAPKLMRRGTSEYLVYHPNAIRDGQDANVDGAKTAGVRIDLSAASGSFQVEWMRARDGATRSGSSVSGGGSRTLTAPWTGEDVVLWLRSSSSPPPNQSPSATLTEPSAGATFTAPATITLRATASDPDGTVVRVEFLSGSTVIGSDSSAPYSITWNSVGSGTYSLSARATDDDGAGGTSAAVSIQVTGSSSPPAIGGLVLIDADLDLPIAGFDPLEDGALLNLGTLPTRNLSVIAGSPNAAVESVRFEYDGDPDYKLENVEPYAIAGDAPGPDYNPWTPSVGSHALVVTPYSADGASGSPGTPLTFTFTVIDDPTTPSRNGPPGGGGGTNNPTGGGSKGSCGATGIEALILLAGVVLLRGRRGGNG